MQRNVRTVWKNTQENIFVLASIRQVAHFDGRPGSPAKSHVVYEEARLKMM